MKRTLQPVTCKICKFETKTNGIAEHIKYKHKISTADYIKKYGEYRPKYLKYLNRSKTDSGQICKICKKPLASERHLTYHIKRVHQLQKKDYIIKYILNNKIPLCKCGCCKQVRILKTAPYHTTYISGHNKSTLGLKYSDESKKLMSDIRIRNLASNKFDTGPELAFGEFLESLDIKYYKQVATKYGCIDFFIPSYDLYVEIDGTYWHPTTSTNLNFQLMSSRIADFHKSSMSGLIRIRETDIKKLKTINDLKKYNFEYNFTLMYDDIIMEKNFFKSYQLRKGKDKLKYYMWVIRKFIRTFSPEFPYPTTSETLDDVIAYLSQKNLEDLYQDKVFNGMCHHIGNSFLKSKFKSYWHSSYKTMGKSPVDAFYDDFIFMRLLEFGIGYNNPNRVYNLSLKKIISWIAQHKYSISFFKPLLAASIYSHFLGNIDSPTVIDPCAGFGGRMVGFKSIYPNGTYIGIEPNPETFNELMELSKNFKNVKLYNCKLEDYNGTKKCDLTFTSIPYYNTEMYSNPTIYNNIDNWKSTFIKDLLTFNNLLINTSEHMKNLFTNIDETYFIKYKASQFSNKSATVKHELLLKLK